MFPLSYLRMEKVCSSEMLLAMCVYRNTQPYSAFSFDYFVTWTFTGQPYEENFVCSKNLPPVNYGKIVLMFHN